MKSCSSALSSFLENTTSFFRADLYTITLVGGAVLRWSGASMPIKSSIQVDQASQGPYTWSLGPPIGDKGVQNARGVQPASVDIVIACGDGRFQVGGEDVRDFVFNLGFDGALIRIDRAYAASVSDMSVNGPVGSYCRFSGRYNEAKELGPTQVVVTATDWRDCLDTEYPKVEFQSSCNNVFGDANCGVQLSGIEVAGTVENTGPNTPTYFRSTATGLAVSDMNLGSVEFTSGLNAGLARSVVGYTPQFGAFGTSAPFPSAPSNGDTFTACPACPLTTAGCQRWQGAVPSHTPWQQRFRGTPFVPPPSTGLPT